MLVWLYLDQSWQDCDNLYPNALDPMEFYLILPNSTRHPILRPRARMQPTTCNLGRLPVIFTKKRIFHPGELK